MKFLKQKGLTPIAIVLLVTALALAVFLAKKAEPIAMTVPSAAPAPVQTSSPTPLPTPTPTPEPTPAPTPKAGSAPLASATPVPKTTNNTPPDAGYSYQNISVDGQTFSASIIAADLNSTKIIVDTASDSDCSNNCPALSLAEYVSRNGAYAGINGSFFCPAEYPSCAGKTNTFDTLLMNKNKHYFNSDNNVYSTIPAAIFSAGSARFVGQSLEWGRDSSPDSVIANYPLLIAGGNINFLKPLMNPNSAEKLAGPL